MGDSPFLTVKGTFLYRSAVLPVRKFLFSSEGKVTSTMGCTRRVWIPSWISIVTIHFLQQVRGRGFDYATLIRDFNLVKWFGANSIRTSKHPPPKELLELADSHGIVVIDESPAVGLKEMLMYGNFNGIFAGLTNDKPKGTEKNWKPPATRHDFQDKYNLLQSSSFLIRDYP